MLVKSRGFEMLHYLTNIQIRVSEALVIAYDKSHATNLVRIGWVPA